MTERDINTSSYKEKLVFVIVFIILFFSHDTVMFGQNSANIFILVGKLMPMVTIAILVLYKKIGTKMTYSEFFFSIFLFGLPFLSCFANGESVSNYIYRFTVMLCAFMVAKAFSEDDIKNVYIRLLVFLSTWSLAVMAIAYFLPGLIRRLPIVINNNGMVFYNSVFSLVSFTDRWGGLLRNFCIFREQGVFVIFLILGILFELGKEKPSTKRIVLFAITIITTFSTAGFILLAASIVFWIITSRDFKHKTFITVLAGLAIIFILTTTDWLNSDSIVFLKFQRGSNAYGSWYSRQSSLTENLKIAFQHPLFGIGRYHLYDTVLAIAENGRYVVRDNTNTITIGYAAYGLLYGLITTFAIINYCIRRTSNLAQAALVFMIIFGILSNEDIGQNVMYYLLLFWGIKKNSTRHYAGSHPI